MTLDVKRYPILVVDDEQDNLDAFRFNFRKTFDILTATSGAEALVILAEKNVAVIVTDQRMPKMTGVELLREVRAKTPETVGIILTAFTDLGRPLRARDLCVALDLPIASKNTENIRSKLKRLVSRGILIETEPGLFARPRP